MRKLISFLCAAVMVASTLVVANAGDTNYVLTLDSYDAEAKTATVTVDLNWDNNVGSVDFGFEVVDGNVEVSNISIVSDTSGMGLNALTRVAGYSANAVATSTLCTLTLTFSDSWDSDIVVTLDGDSMVGDDDDDFYLEDGDVTANSITIPAPAGEDPIPVVEAALESVTGNEDWDAAVAKEWADGTENIVSVADIFKITATANDYNTGAITGLTVSVEGNEKNVNTAIAAGDNVTIAVVIGYKGTESKHFVPTVTAIVE